MEITIVIGNAISFVAAIFTILSSLSEGRKRIYGFQIVQCALMAVGSIFFMSLSGLTTFLLCAIRNYYLAVDRYSKRICILFTLLVAALGIWSNNRGLVGMLPVLTTVIYSVGSYYFKEDAAIKLNICLNLTLWAIYDIFILDFVSLVIDVVSVVTTFYAVAIESRKQSFMAKTRQVDKEAFVRDRARS